MTKRRLASYGLNLVGVALLYALITLAFTFNAFGKSTTYIQGICTTACYTIIMVTSLNLVVGFMGEFSMGHAGFVSVGAYVSAIVSGALAGHGLSDLALLLEEKLEDWRGKYICVANVHTTVTAHDDPTYQAVQNGAVMALPDGGPLSKFSREQGYVDAARVTGPDLMKEMLKESADKHYRHYFYGSTQETLDILKATIEKNYPGAVIAGMYSPPFRPLTPEEDAAVIRRINETKPDFVWVGLGAPKQERWMAAHEDKVQAVMVGVGAAFDYEAGNIRRAPMWMQRHNLEWLYRLMQDPKRLFKRYLTTNIKYLWWTWKQ